MLAHCECMRIMWHACFRATHRPCMHSHSPSTKMHHFQLKHIRGTPAWRSRITWPSQDSVQAAVKMVQLGIHLAQFKVHRWPMRTIFAGESPLLINLASTMALSFVRSTFDVVKCTTTLLSASLRGVVCQRGVEVVYSIYREF